MSRTVTPALAPERRRQTLLYIVVSMLVLGATVFIPARGFTVPPNDFQLVAWDPGQQLLQRGSVDLTYPYPLWTPVLMLPFVLWSPVVGAQLWLFCNLLMLALGVVTIMQVVGWRLTIGTVALVSLFVGVYDPVFTSLWLGQLVFISLLALVLLVPALRSGRWGAVGALLAASLIKPQVTILVTLAILGVAAWQRRWAVFGAFGAGLALLVALAAPFAAVPRQILGGGVGEHLTTYLARTSTLWGLSLTLLPGSLALVAAIGCALLGWIAYEWFRALRAGQIAERLPYLAAITAIVNLLIVPYSWSYNQAILVFPFAYAIERAWRMGGYARAAWLAALFVLIYPFGKIIYATLTQPYRSDVFQIIPVIVFLPLLVVLERSSRASR